MQFIGHAQISAMRRNIGNEHWSAGYELHFGRTERLQATFMCLRFYIEHRYCRRTLECVLYVITVLMHIRTLACVLPFVFMCCVVAVAINACI